MNKNEMNGINKKFIRTQKIKVKKQNRVYTHTHSWTHNRWTTEDGERKTSTLTPHDVHARSVGHSPVKQHHRLPPSCVHYSTGPTVSHMVSLHGHYRLPGQLTAPVQTVSHRRGGTSFWLCYNVSWRPHQPTPIGREVFLDSLNLERTRIESLEWIPKRNRHRSTVYLNLCSWY